jgi:hypothetical protein
VLGLEHGKMSHLIFYIRFLLWFTRLPQGVDEAHVTIIIYLLAYSIERNPF